MIGTAPSVTVGGGTLTSVGSRGSTEGLGLGEMGGWIKVVVVTVEDGSITGVLEVPTGVLESVGRGWSPTDGCGIGELEGRAVLDVKMDLERSVTVAVLEVLTSTCEVSTGVLS